MTMANSAPSAPPGAAKPGSPNAPSAPGSPAKKPSHVSFNVHHYKAFAIIKFTPQIDAKEASAFEGCIPEIIQPTTSVLIFDLLIDQKVPPIWIRSMAKVAHFLNKASIKFRMVTVSPDHLNTLNTEGVLELFPVCSTLKQAVDELNQFEAQAAECKDVDAEFIHHLADAATYTMKVLCQLDVKISSEVTEKEGTEYPQHVMSRVDFKSEGFPGYLLLLAPMSFLEDLLARIVKKSGNTAYSKKQLAEFSVELLNVIYGRTKTLLSYRKYDFQMSMPYILAEIAPEKKRVNQDKRVTIVFQSEAGAFRVAVCPKDSSLIKFPPEEGKKDEGKK